MSLNKVFLIGNLGADPDVRFTPSGKQVTELRLATSFGSGDNAVTEWHRVVCWDKTAEIAGKYLKKGSKAFVEGRIQQRQYEDKDGNQRWITEIVASGITLLDKKEDKADSAPAPTPAAETVAPKSRTRRARPQAEAADDPFEV